MVNSIKSTKAINSFQYVAIPSARDAFAMYGERTSKEGSFCTSQDEVGDPVPTGSESMIASVIRGQKLVQHAVEDMNK